MSDEEFLVTLREAFLVEAQEHLQAMTAGLLELERNPPPDRRRELVEITFREAHSLKGAARAVGRIDIESLFQELETIFAEWTKHLPAVEASQFDVLNRCLDLVGRLVVLPHVAQSPVELRAIDESLAELRHFSTPLQGEKAVAPITQDEATTAKSADPPQLQRPPAKKKRAPRAQAPPAAETSVIPAAVPAAPVKTPAATPAEGERAPVMETIRVSMAKLDAMLLQAEEMISVKLIAGQHVTDLRELETAFEAWHARHAKVRDTFRLKTVVSQESGAAEVRDFMEWNFEFMSSLEKKIKTLTRNARQEERSAGGLVDNLLDGAKKLVMMPCSTLLDIFPKQVRDLARNEGKEVDLSIQGREVELDKRILEEMKAPLIHLVRNAVDHGLEDPETRVRLGKPRCNTLSLTVSQAEGNKVLICVKDDGRGLQAERLKATAVRKGVLSQEEADRLTDDAAHALIFQSGFSTSPIVTEVSGRGLGMAIVKEKVMKLGGTMTVESTSGKGTVFRILLPVTLATFKGILVRAGSHSFVVPVASAERIKRFRVSEIKTMEGRETVDLDGRAVAFVRLADVLELPKRAADDAQEFVETLVLGSGDTRIAFGVDAVLNEQEVLVKNLGRPLLRVRNIAAATVLGTGTPVLILNTTDLLKSAVLAASTARYAPARPVDKETKVSRILVADDSVTSRMLIKNILETSGYSVETATDGMEALTSLRSREFDLLVSDVEMPRMNGFELTSSVRSDQKLHEMPVVLVTALSSRQDRERGIDAGANAYIVKSSFDQSDLLSVISNLI